MERIVVGVYRARAFHCVALTLAVLAIVAVAPDRAAAQRLTFDNGFRSPSGNIHCQYFNTDDVLRCDLKEIANRPLPKPRDCENDWGQAFEVFGRKADTGPICYGDTVMDDRLPVLGYGERWQRGDFVCHSERTGVSCLNSLGAGFELSRSTQTVLRSNADKSETRKSETRKSSTAPPGANTGGKSIGGSID
jgi:hypothetical protein